MGTAIYALPSGGSTAAFVGCVPAGTREGEYSVITKGWSDTPLYVSVLTNPSSRNSILRIPVP